ncbi:G-protein coupled receptor-associated sorting protein 2 [Saccharothrix espanaensis DSM 44229]|uniref:G-protein coupled receptor-associated sorting protein 2 n=1 Tax=Saccharothrix espanaensis (strain ATCC 51144 / DSM 44229 / JCM 9112 / NBRC 15066 / NRRL 15764) TaxID=1179773 RepID=K0JRZ4_SACES|nr:G-protein coupled receptor-associated sorting protein 2 [Saccharothrix espanaensis DSM 44229]
MRPSPLRVGLAAAAASAVSLALVTPASAAPSPDALIAEVYGGGGNSGATLTQDFVELANRGSAPVSLAGWSVQYLPASASAASQWQVTPLTGSVEAGKRYLVAEARGAGGTVELPAPDATGSIALSATGGTVALVTATAPLTCKTAADCAADTRVRDLVGYGTSTVVREGTPTGNLANATSAARPALDDTDDNSADFAVGAPTPVNSKGQGPGDVEPEPEPGDKRIRDIQGTTRVSPLLGAKVAGVPGVVTASRATGDRGFWIQDTAPDADPRTSEGVFVYTGNLAPTAEPGDSVLVSGTIAEYRPGGDTAGNANLTLTEITNATVTVLTKGNALPAPIVLTPPDGFIPTAGGGSIEALDLNPAAYGQDYYESLEGMYVQVDDARVVGPTNSFGETWITTKPPRTRPRAAAPTTSATTSPTAAGSRSRPVAPRRRPATWATCGAARPWATSSTRTSAATRWPRSPWAPTRPVASRRRRRTRRALTSCPSSRTTWRTWPRPTTRPSSTAWPRPWCRTWRHRTSWCWRRSRTTTARPTTARWPPMRRSRSSWTRSWPRAARATSGGRSTRRTRPTAASRAATSGWRSCSTRRGCPSWTAPAATRRPRCPW